MDEGTGSEVTDMLPAPRERTDTLPLGLPERTLGYHAAAWMMDNLIQPNGPKAGQPFIPTDRQIEFLAHFYALNHKGGFVYRQGIRRLAKGSGKGHALVTPILTPSGWRRFGDLTVGDYVFHPSGKPTAITQLHPVGQWDTWEVEVSDGTVLTLTGEHLFTVEEFVGSVKRKRRTLDVRTMAREGEFNLRLPDVDKEALRANGVSEGVLASFQNGRTIVGARQVPPVDARCITVEAEDGLYLVGETMVVTHNSPFAAAMCLFELLGPCRYDGFDRHEPFGVRAKPMSMPLVQIVATSESQPLALSTKVPVEGGWSTVGGLNVGDMVYGSDGKPTPVLGKTRVFTDRACYRVEFDDGTTVTADSGHGWTVERKNLHGDRFDTVTLTTAEMKSYLSGGRNRSIRVPVVPRRGGPKAPSLVSPYMLGYWLGDGDRNGSMFAINWKHKDEISSIFRGELEWWDDLNVTYEKKNEGRIYVRRHRNMCPRGHSYTEGDPNRTISSSGHPMCLKCNRGKREGMKDVKLLSFRERLRELGVLGDKHVPDSYLHASYEDRLALLQGFVDSDGTVSEKGMVRFTNMSARLLTSFIELAESLGQKCFVRRGDHGSRVVTFIPQPGFPAARLSRHVARLPKERRPLSAYRRVVAVKPGPSVPVQCVQIGTEDHLFQVESGVLTHNTANTIRMVRAFCQKKGTLARKYDLEVAKTFIETPGGGKLQQMTSSAHSMEGGEVSFVVGDELEHWLPAQGGPAMLQTIQQNAAKMGGRFMGTCNAWVPGEQSSAEAVFEAWCDQEDGLTRGKTKILYDARIAPPNTVLTDEPEEGQVGLTKALEYVYEDCPWVNLESIKEQIWSPEYPESRSIRFFLNRPNAAEASWITLEEWTQLRKPDRKVEPGEKIVMFFDGSKSNDHTALVGCCMEDGHIFKIGHWKPEKPLGVVNVAAVDAGVRRAFDTYNVVAFWADVREWESFTRTAWPEDFGDRLIVPAVRGGMSASPIAWDMRSHAYQFAEAAETAFTEIQQQAFTHDGDSALGEHVSNCRVNEFKGRWSVKKESPKSSKKIDLAVCMIGARMLYRYVKSSKEWADMNKPVGAWTVIV